MRRHTDRKPDYGFIIGLAIAIGMWILIGLVMWGYPYA